MSATLRLVPTWDEEETVLVNRPRSQRQRQQAKVARRLARINESADYSWDPRVRP